MCAALDRSKGRGKSVEKASKPVMPVATSSTSSSLGALRLGTAGLEDTEGAGGGGEDTGKGEGTGKEGEMQEQKSRECGSDCARWR